MKKPIPIEPVRYDGLEVKPAWNKLIDKLQPMDFFCTQGTGFIGWSIRKITKNLSPDRECEFNHAGLFPEGTECTLEALWTVKSTNFFEHYEGSQVLIGRFNNITDYSAKHALANIVKHIDQPYPIRRLALHLINMAHHIHWSNAVVCSELVAKSLYYMGARGHNYYGATPDNLADEIHRSLNDLRTGPKYKIVHDNSLPFLMYRYCISCKEVHLIDMLQQRCYSCGSRYLEHTAIPDKTIQTKVKEYNDRKLFYIASLNKRR